MPRSMSSAARSQLCRAQIFLDIQPQSGPVVGYIYSHSQRLVEIHTTHSEFINTSYHNFAINPSSLYMALCNPRRPHGSEWKLSASRLIFTIARVLLFTVILVPSLAVARPPPSSTVSHRKLMSRHNTTLPCERSHNCTCIDFHNCTDVPPDTPCWACPLLWGHLVVNAHIANPMQPRTFALTKYVLG